MAILTDRICRALFAATLIVSGDHLFAASGVVGSGTPETCTQDTLAAQIAVAPAGGSITFNCGGHTRIAIAPALEFAASTTLDGDGVITLDGGGSSGIAVVDSGATLTLAHITLAHGAAGSGGAVLVNSGGTLNANNATFFANYAQYGGAIANGGTANLIGVNIYGNDAALNGGGIHNSGTLTLRNSSVNQNGADGTDDDGFLPPHDPYGGGGIQNFGTLTMTNVSVLDDFTYWGDGGGLRNDGQATIAYSTFLGNDFAAVPGSDISERGAGIFADSGTVNISASVLVNGNRNCEGGGSLISGGYNMADASCGALSTPTDVVGASATMSAAANNGGSVTDATGPLITSLPAPGSAALNAIPNGTLGCGGSVSTDARGYPRPANGSCDRGAVEVQTAPPPATGSVAVYTYVDGPEAPTVPGGTQYKFNLTCGSTTFPTQTATSGGSTVFHNVPTGTCSIAEDTSALPVQTGLDWAAPTCIPSASFVVNGGDTTSVTVANRASGNGTVEVKTKLIGAAFTGGLVHAGDTPWTFTLTCGSTTLSLDIGVGLTDFFHDVPAGSCTLAGGPKYATAYTFLAPTYSPGTSLTVARNSSTAVHVTEDAELTAKSVYVFVSLTGTGAQIVGNFIPYSLTLTCGSSVQNGSAAPNSPAVFTNVPAGSCTLTQGAPFPYPGVTFSAPAFSPSATFTMPANGPATINVTETATANPNSVEVFVQLVGPQAGNVSHSTTFPVKLTCGGTTLSQNAPGFAVFTNVPAGTCTVSQGTLPTIAGVVWGTPVYSAPFTMTAGGNHEATIINTANASALTTGTLTVYPGVTGPLAGSLSFDVQIPVAVTCGSNAPINASISRNAPGAFTGLPVGTCSVGEGTLPPLPNVVWGPPVYLPSRTVNIVAGGTTQMTIDNAVSPDAIFSDDFN